MIRMIYRLGLVAGIALMATGSSVLFTGHCRGLGEMIFAGFLIFLSSAEITR